MFAFAIICIACFSSGFAQPIFRQPSATDADQTQAMLGRKSFAWATINAIQVNPMLQNVAAWYLPPPGGFNAAEWIRAKYSLTGEGGSPQKVVTDLKKDGLLPATVAVKSFTGKYIPADLASKTQHLIYGNPLHGCGVVFAIKAPAAQAQHQKNHWVYATRPLTATEIHTMDQQTGQTRDFYFEGGSRTWISGNGHEIISAWFIAESSVLQTYHISAREEYQNVYSAVDTRENVMYGSDDQLEYGQVTDGWSTGTVDVPHGGWNMIAVALPIIMLTVFLFCVCVVGATCFATGLFAAKLVGSMTVGAPKAVPYQAVEQV